MPGNIREHEKKNLAFLAGHSAKPPPLPVSRKIAIFEISKIRHGKWPFFKNSKISPEKKSYTAETGKDKFRKIPDNTATEVDYLTSRFFFEKSKKKLTFLSCRGSDPPPPPPHLFF